MNEIDFSDASIKERDHIEKWVIENPEVLGEDLLIITSEYDNYEELKQRLDVLALDKNGKIVVIELKRDKADKTTDLQAIKYASYVATHTAEEIQEEYRKFWKDKKDEEVTKEYVSGKFQDFLSDTEVDVEISDEGWAEFELDDKPRIILAAGNFGKEVTSPIMWLIEEYGLDFTCIELQAFEYEGKIFLNNRQVIPVPETEEYMAKRREKEEKQEKTRRIPAIKVLLERGVLKEGDEVVFKESKVSDECEKDYTPEDDFWRAKVTGQKGQSDNIEWLEDGEKYSFSGLSKEILSRVEGRDKSRSLNGYKYWIHPEFDYRTLSELRNSKVTGEERETDKNV